MNTLAYPSIRLELRQDIVSPDGILPTVTFSCENATESEVVQILKLFFNKYITHTLAMSPEFETLVFTEMQKVPKFVHFGEGHDFRGDELAVNVSMSKESEELVERLRKLSGEMLPGKVEALGGAS